MDQWVIIGYVMAWHRTGYQLQTITYHVHVSSILDRSKMATVMQTTFWDVLSDLWYFHSFFFWNLSQGSNWSRVSIGLNNELAPTRRQAIEGTNDYSVHCDTYGSPASVCWPLTCGDRIIPVQLVNIMAANALAPCITRTSAPMVLTMENR